MLSNRFKVRHKETKEVSEVYDIIHISPATFGAETRFLVYLDGEFSTYNATKFELYTEDLCKGSRRPLNENISNNYTFEDGM